MRAKVRANVLLAHRLVVMVEKILHGQGQRVGTAGGLYYWRHHLRGPRLELGGGLPRIGYDGGCAGGDSTTVLAGFCMNLLLLCLFVRFYRRAYGGPKALRARS